MGNTDILAAFHLVLKLMGRQRKHSAKLQRARLITVGLTCSIMLNLVLDASAV